MYNHLKALRSAPLTKQYILQYLKNKSTQHVYRYMCHMSFADSVAPDQHALPQSLVGEIHFPLLSRYYNKITNKRSE